FSNGHLPRPSAFVSPLVRKRERIFEGLNQALGIGGGWPRRIRILWVQAIICGTWIARAPVSPRIARLLAILRHSAACRQTASHSGQRSRSDSKKPPPRNVILAAVIF